jgi:hypothetical protein
MKGIFWSVITADGQNDLILGWNCSSSSSSDSLSFIVSYALNITWKIAWNSS